MGALSRRTNETTQLVGLVMENLETMDMDGRNDEETAENKSKVGDADVVFVENPFVKSKKVPRTPPAEWRGSMQDLRENVNGGGTRNRTSSIPDRPNKIQRMPALRKEELALERPSKKRKGEELDPPPKEQTCSMSEQRERLFRNFHEAMELIKKIQDVSGRLSQLVEGNPNTKVEIKKGIAELEGITGRLDKKSGKMVKPFEEFIEHSQTKDVPKISFAVQTDGREKLNKEESRRQTENRTVPEIEEALRKERVIDDFMKVIDMKWPSKYFRKAICEKVGVFPKGLVPSYASNRRP